MIALIIDIISWGLVACGGFFLLAGGIGMLRMPNFYTRVHAASLIDTLGVFASLGALVLQMDTVQTALKVALIALFLLITLPATTHALVKAARHHDKKEIR